MAKNGHRMRLRAVDASEIGGACRVDVDSVDSDGADDDCGSCCSCSCSVPLLVVH